MLKLIWKRIGFVPFPQDAVQWATDSLLQPTPFLLNSDVIRVFVGMRDDRGRSRVGFVDVAARKPDQVLNICRTPSLDIGAPGMFDENGVVPCAVILRENQLYLYYAGYQTAKTARFHVFSGLAKSSDNGDSFTRVSSDPILPPTIHEPLFRVIHSILPSDDGNWDVWYGGGNTFRQGATKTLPVYDVRQMRSDDGIVFPEQSETAIHLRPEEHRVGRPYVLRTADGYLMFYGYGSEMSPYQLGMAHSDDGKSWIRNDHQMQIEGERQAWETEMQAYPSIIQAGCNIYLFYNGNAYGRDGFGCCRLGYRSTPPFEHDT
jgi:hypothetical protein